MKTTFTINAVFLAFVSLFIPPARGQTGSLDITFNPGAGPNDLVTCMAVQPNGKILIGGYFASVDGQSRNYIAQLNSDGSLNSDFTPLQGPNDVVWAITSDTDGKVLIGGSFTSVNSVSRNHFARLRGDGSLDTMLTNVLFDRTVKSVRRQEDGNYLVLGAFSEVNGVSRFGVARLRSDGSLDTAFNPTSKITRQVNDAAILPDGKVMLAGEFTTVDNTDRSYIARVNSDGTLDPTFDAGSIGGGSVTMLLVQPDGRIIIAGGFSSVNGYSRQRVARLNTDGTVDTKFVLPGVLYNDIRAIDQQQDGKIIVVGSFSYSFAGTFRQYIARLNTNGSLDSVFYPRFDLHSSSISGADLYAVAIQPDGKILTGGSFQSVGETKINNIVRLNGDDSFDAGMQFLAPNQYFGTYLSGTINTDYRVEWTTNLNTPSLWTPLYNLTLQTNPQFIFDSNAISGQKRFYRAIALP